jgi:hypothetical protein
MTFQRRHRWFRRFALGFAFATVLFAGNVSAAAAVVAEGGSQSTQVAPSGDEIAIRNAIASRQLAEVFIPGVTDFPQPTATATATRPDDRADRFAHIAPQSEPASSGWNVEWNQALTFGIGGLVLVLALGLGVGYLRRPRLAL